MPKQFGPGCGGAAATRRAALATNHPASSTSVMTLGDEPSAGDAIESLAGHSAEMVHYHWRLKQLKIDKQPRGKLDEFWAQRRLQLAELQRTQPDLVKKLELIGQHNSSKKRGKNARTALQTTASVAAIADSAGAADSAAGHSLTALTDRESHNNPEPLQCLPCIGTSEDQASQLQLCPLR